MRSHHTRYHTLQVATLNHDLATDLGRVEVLQLLAITPDLERGYCAPPVSHIIFLDKKAAGVLQGLM